MSGTENLTFALYSGFREDVNHLYWMEFCSALEVNLLIQPFSVHAVSIAV